MKIPNYVKRNLAKLALVLRNLPKSDKFGMSGFLWDKALEEQILISTMHPITACNDINQCGTCACAIGWAAVNKIGTIKPDDNWNNYSNREFVSGLESELTCDEKDDIFQFLFGQYHADDPLAAANRIGYYIEKEKLPIEEEDSFYCNPKYDRYEADWDLIEKLSQSQ